MSYARKSRPINGSKGMFEPDTLVHAKYYEVFRMETSIEPEKKLMFAVLEEGTSCFQTYIFAGDERGDCQYCQKSITRKIRSRKCPSLPRPAERSPFFLSR